MIQQNVGKEWHKLKSWLNCSPPSPPPMITESNSFCVALEQTGIPRRLKVKALWIHYQRHKYWEKYIYI